MGIPEVLLPQHPSVLASHFRSLVNDNPSLGNINAINDSLLNLIHREAISPSAYRVWLPIALRHSSHFLPAALRDTVSAGVRKSAIRVLRSLSHNPRWKVQGWDHLGGAAGIRDVLDTLPIAEVKQFVGVIAGYSYCSSREQAAACFEELLALVERSEDSSRRSLSKYMRPLRAHCSRQNVIELLASSPPDLGHFLIRLAPLHTDILRQAVTGAIHMPLEVRLEIIIVCNDVLMGSKNDYVPRYATGKEFQSDFSPGFAFSMDLLPVLVTESEIKARISAHQIHKWIQSTLRLAIVRKLPLEHVLIFVRGSLPLYRSKCPDWLINDIPREIIRWWSIAKVGSSGDSGSNSIMEKVQRRHEPRPTVAHQEILKKLVVEEVLQQKDDKLDVQRRRYDFTRTVVGLLSLVGRECRIELLWLICKHSPFLNFDIRTVTPSEREVQLVPVWDYAVLQKLPPGDAKYLFSRSLSIYHCDEFLPSPGEVGREPWSLSWKEQCFLWADAEIATAQTIDDLVMTQKLINEMKQKSMRQRDHSERLVWAETAIQVAARTKSLEIFCDIVDWSKRFLRDPLVFPGIMNQILSNGGRILSCQNDKKTMKVESKADLVVLAQKANGLLMDLLKTILLWLREPGVRPNMRAMKTVSNKVFTLLSSTVNGRMEAVRQYTKGDLATESGSVDILLGSLVPIVIDYEREGNSEEYMDVLWSGTEGVLRNVECPESPSSAELAFMDRIARKRDEFWQQKRVNRNPDILTLDQGLPKGLAVQNLVPGTTWLSHILERQNEAPYVSSRANEVIFAPVDILMAVPPDGARPDGKFVDRLAVLIRAYMGRGKKLEKEKRIMKIWEYYSTILQSRLLNLRLFQNWLADLARNSGMEGAANRIQPDISLTLSIPAVSEMLVEWDPLGGLQDDSEMLTGENESRSPHSGTILNSRTSYFFTSGKLRLGPEAKKENLLSIWKLRRQSLKEVPTECSTATREAVILSALLFLDTFAKNGRILRTKFPDEEYPRYPATYLAGEFITRLNDTKTRDSMQHAISALKEFRQDVPSTLLRDLIWSFMDALKADPDAPLYPDLVWCMFQLLKVLLSTNQPQVIVDVVLRIWKDFPNESSYHRAVSLVKVGNVMTPSQARAFVHNFSAYVCDALKQQQQPGNDKCKPLIKVTTVKMLAQSLAEARFLPQAMCLQILRDIYNMSRHIDIRVALLNSILEMVSRNNDAESYMLFSSMVLSAAGPNEEVTTTEEDWQVAELGGPLPFIAAESDRPILQIVVQEASRKLPERLRSDYVHKVLLPLLQESTRQHVRWMTCFLRKLDLSLSEVGLSNEEVGPFSRRLVNEIFSKWWRYLPAAYMKTQQRSLALSYQQRYTSFNQIAERLATTRHPSRQSSSARGEWEDFFRAHRDQSPLSQLTGLLTIDSDAPGGITIESIIQEYISRAEIMIKHPIRYDTTLEKQVLHSRLPLEILHDLRRKRSSHWDADLVRQEELYIRITGLMEKIIQLIDRLRTDGWASNLSSYAVPLPTPLQCEIVLLPSPRYNPVSPAGVLDEFAAEITGLIRKYESDPALLTEFDSLKSVIGEVLEEDAVACALFIGKIDSQEHAQGFVEMWFRVKLAQTLLANMTRRAIQSNENVKDMVRTWKTSGHELIRQVGWVVDSSLN